ncbi:kinase-like domain-containing protein [Sporodiniella umbellata]|nr:kinase-like domain-containing protein [Sporodiniella umbellata]
MTPEKFIAPIATPEKNRQEVGDYFLGKTLGQGTSACVKIGVHKLTGERVAIKIIPKAYLAANIPAQRSVQREIAIMKLMKHPYIVSLLDVIDLPESSDLYLVLEYIEGGELFDYLISQGRLNEEEARKYFQQILTGLEYCHKHLICHRDLKPENLLLDKNMNIKIADFGMASLQPAGSLLETSCGSPHYASPEVVNGFAYDGSASDVWSCGVILYALLSGSLPFDYDDIRQLLRKVKRGKYKIPSHISCEAKDLIQKILVINPGKRLTLKEVQIHPWYTVSLIPSINVVPDPPMAIDGILKSTIDIDGEILEALKALWTELSTRQIKEELLSKENNMQKVTYMLLKRYNDTQSKTKKSSVNHLKDQLHAVHPKKLTATSPKRNRRPVTICTLPANTEPMPGMEDVIEKYEKRKPPKILHRQSFPQNFQPGTTPKEGPCEDKKIKNYRAPLAFTAKKKQDQINSWLSPVIGRFYNKPQYLPNIQTDQSRAKIPSLFRQKLHDIPRSKKVFYYEDAYTFDQSNKKSRQAKVEPKGFESPVIESHPKRSSRLLEFFSLKAPKVCTMECQAVDQKEVLEKLSRFLHKVRVSFFFIAAV